MPAQLSIPKGSLEVLYVSVTDRLEQLTTLDTAAISYEVWDNESDVDSPLGPQLSGGCSNEGMTVITNPVDTAMLEEGPHRLFIRMVMGAEDIVLGPFDFIVG
jgi:hypothetical protein